MTAHPAKNIVAYLFIACALGFCAYMLLRTLLPGAVLPKAIEPQAYFYNLTTGTLFTCDAALLPPVDVPAQAGEPPKPGQGVRARVFSCSNCSPATEPSAAFIETYTDQARELLDSVSLTNPTQDNQDAYLRENNLDRMVAIPSVKPTWIPSSSPAGIALFKKATQECPDKSPARECLP